MARSRRDPWRHVRARIWEAALNALDQAVANESETGPDVEVDADNPFFTAPTFSSGQSDVSRNVDECLAEDTYRDTLGSDQSS